MAISRSEFEATLAAALSRHIGYTTGAYSINRIATISKLFSKQPSLYQYELVQHVIDQSREFQRPVRKRYATEIINFAGALGILHKVADGPTPGARRFALTPEGFTIKSALQRDETSLLKFSLAGLVLACDCDAYGLLLDILHESTITGVELHRAFRRRSEILRSERLSWLDQAFPNRILRDRIHEKMAWVAHQGRSRSASTDFGRHHVTPRAGWAKWLGHLDSDWPSSAAAGRSPLTQQGVELLCALRGTSHQYTWLGPERGTQEALGIPRSVLRDGPYAPSWNLLRPNQFRQSMPALTRLADDVTDFMHTHYQDLKLIHANQASIASVLPYLHLRERQLGYAIETQRLLDHIFRAPSPFSYLSSRRHKYAYFQRADL